MAVSKCINCTKSLDAIQQWDMAIAKFVQEDFIAFIECVENVVLLLAVTVCLQGLRVYKSNQWRNYYGLRPGGPTPMGQMEAPGLGDRAKTLARASDMLQCRFMTIRIL